MTTKYKDALAYFNRILEEVLNSPLDVGTERYDAITAGIETIQDKIDGYKTEYNIDEAIKAFKGAKSISHVDGGWLPIESAPKDGTAILVVDDNGETVSAQWLESWYGDESKACFITAYHDEEYGSDLNPNHWQALPQPPSSPRD